MSRVGVVEAVRAAVTTSHVTNELARCPTAVVRLFGVAVGVAYLPDQAEAARRDAVGLLCHERGEESTGRSTTCLTCRCAGDGGFVALRRRPTGGGVKPPQAALAEDCRGER